MRTCRVLCPSYIFDHLSLWPSPVSLTTLCSGFPLSACDHPCILARPHPHDGPSYRFYHPPGFTTHQVLGLRASMGRSPTQTPCTIPRARVQFVERGVLPCRPLYPEEEEYR